ncbi:MAG: MFS transporter [Novosphingobium sp.]
MRELGAKGALYRWYVVAVLLLVFILSYFDRYILSLLVDPIKQDLGLSNFQMGLLLGPAFSVVNVLFAIPLGWLADRGSRKWILIAGIFFWCTMTAMSGFAMAFLPLVLLRAGLGIGEAVVSPTSISIISDYFSRSTRARALSVYMAGPYLGAGLAFGIGGFLVHWLEKGGWNLGGFQPWQMTFFLVGLPGILLGFVLMTVREPARTDKVAEPVPGARRASVWRFMRQRWQAFGAIFVGATCNFALTTLTFWNVPLFQRVYGWSIGQTGAVTGVFYFTAGPIGTALAVWASRHFAKSGPDYGMKVLILGLFVAIPASALYPIMPTAELAVVLMFIAFMGKSIATAGGPASLSLVTPGDIRGQSAAIFTAVVTVVGPIFGPPIIGWAVDASGDPKFVGTALSAFVTVLGIPSILFVLWARRYYRTAVVELERSLKDEPESLPA